MVDMFIARQGIRATREHFPEPVTGVIGAAIRWTVLLGLVGLLLSFLTGTALA